MMATSHEDLDQTEVLQRLIEFSLAAADAETVSEIARALTELAAPLVGAANAAVATWSPGDETIRVSQGPTATRGNESITVVDLVEATPLTESIRERSEVHVWSYESYVERFPKLGLRASSDEVTAMLTYPLILGDEILGSCFFRFSEGQSVGPTHIVLMEQMVPLLVRAIARIRDRIEIVNYATQLERSNGNLQDFAAVVAHDLSAPVRRIGSFMQLLERELGTPSDKAARYFKTIGAQVEHLDALLRDTLAHSQVASHKNRESAVDLGDVASSVVAAMTEDLTMTQAEVVIGDMPVVDAVESLIRQVVQNLIDNSLKYRSKGRPPRIEITAELESPGAGRVKPMWRISVQDNGIGIDPAQAKEVFSMFTRLAVSEDRPGTGVGLAFVKQVVEQHGGKIGLGDSPGQGTLVWFTLPGIEATESL